MLIGAELCLAETVLFILLAGLDLSKGETWAAVRPEAGLALCFLIAAGPLFAVGWWRAGRRWHLEHEGRPTEAVVTAVRPSRLQFSGYHFVPPHGSTYIVGYEYHDPEGRLRRGKSLYLSQAEAALWTAGDRAVVRVDPQEAARSVWTGDRPAGFAPAKTVRVVVVDPSVRLRAIILEVVLVVMGVIFIVHAVGDARVEYRFRTQGVVVSGTVLNRRSGRVQYQFAAANRATASGIDTIDPVVAGRLAPRGPIAIRYVRTDVSINRVDGPSRWRAPVFTLAAGLVLLALVAVSVLRPDILRPI